MLIHDAKMSFTVSRCNGTVVLSPPRLDLRMDLGDQLTAEIGIPTRAIIDGLANQTGYWILCRILAKPSLARV